MKLIVTTLFLISIPYSLTPQECKCREPERGATTRQGYFASILVEPKTRYKELVGVVYLSDTPVEGVLVELFPYSKDLSTGRPRLAACVTGPDGRYCFINAPKGRYEVRVSKDGGFQIIHVNVYFDPKNSKASHAELGITLEVSY